MDILIRILFEKMGCENCSVPVKDKVVVTYFGLGYARADPIRFLLHHANVEYEYVGLDFA